MSSVPKPFQILNEIAQNSIKSAAGLPQQDEAVELWNGIGFLIAGTHYVAEMGTVSEILHLPKYTAIPGVKNWMRGVANVRGRLLPIMDLGRFFDLPAGSSKTRDKRVLVVEHADALSGVIVDGVLGMQYFSAESFENKVSTDLPASIKPFVTGSFSKADIDWNVFSTSALTANEQFVEVALG